MDFSEKMRKETSPIWNTILNHPFLVELAKGILPMDKFAFYIRQDYVYLVDFCRAVAVADSRVQDIEDFKGFTEFLNKTINLEMGGIERYAKNIGISAKQLSETKPAPSNYAYTRHILCSAYTEPFNCFLAAIMPCMQSYLEVAESITKKQKIREVPAYSTWLETYQADKYAGIVDWLKRLLNKYSQDVGQWEILRMRNLYLTSSRYEYMFWDMAYKLEEWQV
jgi:thiaminase/transcriptional activator TenA